MGRTLDVLLGRTTKQTARLRSLLHLATRRVAVVRAHREVRCAQARGDVEQLLRQGHPDRALLRAEQVIRERDTLDALLLLDAYCALLADRSALLDAAHGRECPAELREAAAGSSTPPRAAGTSPSCRRPAPSSPPSSAAASRPAPPSSAAAAASAPSSCRSSRPRCPASRAARWCSSRSAPKEIPVRLHNDATAAAEHEDPAGRSRHGHGHRKMRHDDDDERRADSDEPEETGPSLPTQS
ncbi:hypothetical protein ZWY2020_053736 [Hordeum vulgare]|nr:hypothetical protein ZWY2020_053736 [Hordeum vulgare]